MIDFRNMFWVEWRKLIRARLPWITLLGFLIVPFVDVFFMIILRDPQVAQDIGLIRTKAAFVGGAADWPNYLNVFMQAIAIGTVFLYGLIMAWIFGREFADHTFDNLLAVPVPRGVILLAKFAVAALWCLLMTVFVYLLTIGLGFALDLPLASPEIIAEGSALIALAVVQMIVLSFVVGLAASMGRGYLPGVGFIVLTLAFAQILIVIGWGDYFPWSVPPLSVGMVDGVSVGPVSYWLVALTGLGGMAATYGWWRFADHK